MVSVVLLGSSTAAGRAPTSGDAVRTLSALVPGAVDGAIRDVQLLATAGAQDPDLATVAEHAGCAYLAASLPQALAEAVKAARSPQILVLLAGVSFDRALTDEMAGVAARHARWLAEGVGLKAAESSPLGRLLPRFAPTLGVLTTRDRLAAVSPASVPALWRALRPRRTFKTHAWSGGGD